MANSGTTTADNIPLQDITDGERSDEDYLDDDLSSGGDAAGANGISVGVGSAMGGTGLGDTPNYQSGSEGMTLNDDDSGDLGGVRGDGMTDMGNGNYGTGSIGAGNAGMAAMPVLDSAMDTGSDSIAGFDPDDHTEGEDTLTGGATTGSRDNLGSNGGDSSGSPLGGQSSGGSSG